MPSDQIPTSTADRMLTFRSAGRACALPVGTVEETLRPLHVDTLDGAPPFVLGLSTVRGEPTPVVDLAMVLTGSAEAIPRRWVSVRAGGRRVALAVAEVIGVRRLDGESIAELPTLLSGGAAEHVESVARLDDHLVLVLRAGRLLPEGFAPAPSIEGGGA